MSLIFQIGDPEPLTIFGQVVDDCVELTVSEEIGHFGADVERHVDDAQAPLTGHTRVEHCALGEGAVILRQLVVVFDFDCHRFIAVD